MVAKVVADERELVLAMKACSQLKRPRSLCLRDPTGLAMTLASVVQQVVQRLRRLLSVERHHLRRTSPGHRASVRAVSAAVHFRSAWQGRATEEAETWREWQRVQAQMELH